MPGCTRALRKQILLTQARLWESQSFTQKKAPSTLSSLYFIYHTSFHSQPWKLRCAKVFLHKLVICTVEPESWRRSILFIFMSSRLSVLVGGPAEEFGLSGSQQVGRSGADEFRNLTSQNRSVGLRRNSCGSLVAIDA